MARVTVEDCIDKVESPYELVLVAKERSTQLNAGIENQRVNNEKNIGLDVKNNKEGDLIDMGIIDPMKVTKQALQNAVSVAVTILSTNAIVTMARTYESK